MTTTYTSYKLITADLTKSLARVAEQPDVARETEYYLSKIGDVKTIDDFFADSRLYNYAMKAHGLEDMGYAKAFMRKVLTEGVDNEDAFANKLTDSRYKQLVESLNFAAHGSAATSFDRAQKGVAEKYTRQTLEQDAGEENAGVRLALYFSRMAPTIDSGYAIIADEALAQVVRTALQLPDEFAATNVDRQAEAYEQALDFKDFQDPTKVTEFLDRFTALWETKHSTDGYDPLAVFGSSSGYGISSDLLLSINSLKLGGKLNVQTGLYVAISSQMALEKRLNTLADNIANSNTVGFRGTEVKFNEMLGDTKPTKVAYVSKGEEFLNTSNGSLTRTGSALDFAIKGDAWFQIETPAGPALTRDGRFTLTDTGELVTIRGYPVLDAGGAPIQLNGNGGEITVGADGALHQNGVAVASLGLYEADFSKGFVRLDNSAVQPAAQAEPVVDRFDVGVMQGFLEESNVNAIQEMSQLIMVTRAFDNITALLRDSEGSLEEAVKTLGGSR